MDGRDALLQLCRQLAEFGARLECGRVETGDASRIAELINTLDWPCSSMLNARWSSVRRSLQVTASMSEQDRQRFAASLPTLLDSTWTALETTRLCLQSHPELQFAELPAIAVDALLRLRPPPEQRALDKSSQVGSLP